jgi:response regulator RpfG family c-di-GMP phosphodiesterase
MGVKRHKIIIDGNIREIEKEEGIPGIFIMKKIKHKYNSSQRIIHLKYTELELLSKENPTQVTDGAKTYILMLISKKWLAAREEKMERRRKAKEKREEKYLRKCRRKPAKSYAPGYAVYKGEKGIGQSVRTYRG